jgi:hypothetical protein
MSTSEKKVKTLEERLRESMDILKKVRDLGIADTDPGYKALSAKFSEWVKTGEAWSGKVDFFLWNRRADVILPTKKGVHAKCNLMHYEYSHKDFE